MTLTVLLGPDCPNATAATELTHRVLCEPDSGPDPGDARTNVEQLVEGLRFVVVSDEADAERRHFLGSPSWHLHGRDLFAEPGRTPGLACRVYVDGDGLRQGLPTVQALRTALLAAIEHRADAHVADADTEAER
jgi:hypothetical protein